MIRKACMSDIKIIHKTLTGFGNDDLMVPRPLSQLYDHIRDFTIYEIDGEVAGFGALQFCWKNLAEIRSLAVLRKFHNEGIGSIIVDALIEEAKKYDISDLFTLTYQPDFFKQFNFTIVDKSELPLKIWQDCITCVKFPDCDETAMIHKINR
ncbi:MAG: N-acetyltransferase [Desulfobacterales bacterium]|nr:N-acetyltransferase [Desulfobacterales bacterium]MCP4158468.1 N-acetyltransferase [Deltaproteobacteria bacterium]